jgi:hypothetical protein
MASATNPDKLRQGFVLLAESLLKSVADVFPEVDDCAHALELFQALVKGNAAREDAFIRHCRTLFDAETEGLSARDPEAIFRVCDGVEVLQHLDLRSRWIDSDFSEESKANFWQFLSALDTYSGLYCAVPTSVLGKIEGLARQLGDDMQSGQLDLSRLDIGKLGQQLMGSLTKDELQQFESSSTSIYSSISKIGSILQQQTGGHFDVDDLMRRLGDLQNAEGPAADMRSMVQHISSSLAPNLGPELQASVSALLQPDGGVNLSQACSVLQALTAAGAPPATEGAARKRRKT